CHYKNQLQFERNVQYRMHLMSLIAPSTLIRWRLICLHSAVKRRSPTSWLKTSNTFLSVLPVNIPTWDETKSTTLVAVSVGDKSTTWFPPFPALPSPRLKSVDDCVVAQIYSTSSMSTSMPLFRPAATRSSSICSNRFFSFTAGLRKSSL